VGLFYNDTRDGPQNPHGAAINENESKPNTPDFSPRDAPEYPS